jgi:GTPase SAR1 family protein
MHDSFSPVTEETMHIDSKLKHIDNSAIQIWDTAGQENYYALNRIYFRRADACIFVVDINSAEFEHRLDFWINEFMTMGTPATQVNTDGSRTAHSSSVGSSDYHADQLQVVSSVFFSVLVNKVDKVLPDGKMKID